MRRGWQPSGCTNTDKDAQPDYLDKDDDNDGKLTLNESADKNKDGNPADAHDMDADNIPDYLDDKEVPTVVLHVRGLLQGAYSTADGLMRDDLRQRGFIPLAQPYADRLTSFKYRGTETTNATELAITGDDAPVDWVLVELRDKTNPKNRITAQAALLQRDGDVANPLTNEANWLFPNVAEGTYYVSLRYRNHLGVMTKDPVADPPTLTVTDFSLTSFATYGVNARLESGATALMWAGEANNDTNVIANGPAMTPTSYWARY